MSCYVDPLFAMEGRNAPVKRVGERHGHRWCHLWADSLEELHQLAGKIGMKPEWFQDKRGFPHYDLVPPRRAHALRLGAIEFSAADWIRGKRPGLIQCPECKGLVSAHSCEVTVDLLGTLRECSACHVGSLLSGWKSVPAKVVCLAEVAP